MEEKRGKTGKNREQWGKTGGKLGRMENSEDKLLRPLALPLFFFYTHRVTRRLSKAGQMTSPQLRASRSRLVREVIGNLAKSKDMHVCVLTHAT